DHVARIEVDGANDAQGDLVVAGERGPRRRRDRRTRAGLELHVAAAALREVLLVDDPLVGIRTRERREQPLVERRDYRSARRPRRAHVAERALGLVVKEEI